MAETTEAHIDLIRKILPHRYPFLMIDRVTEIEGQDRAVGLKNVTVNEPFFNGHFPTEPVMPGVLIIEALAQTSAVLVGIAKDLVGKGYLVYFMGVDSCKFRRKVVPGDQLKLEVTTARAGGKVWRFKGRATVDGELACECEFMAMVVPPEG